MSAGTPTLYRRCTPVVDTEYDTAADDDLTTALLEAVATAEGTPATELSPMYETVDLDALVLLLEHAWRAGTDATYSFQCGRWNVFVSADGRIRVCDNTAPTEPEPVFASTAGE